MPIQPICSYCRVKRLQCDGARPYCGICTKEILACNYDYDPKVRKTILPKGMACSPCRRDKRRCDGAKPICTSCKKSPKRPDCRYEDTPRFQPEGTESALVKRNQSSKHPNMTKSTTEPTGHVDYAYWWSKLYSSEPWAPPIPHLAYNFWNSDPSGFQLSAISTDDRNLMFRLLYLSYSLVRGNLFTSHKFQAIVQADMSGTRVHPFFVLFAEFSGRHFYQVSRAQWIFWEAQGLLAHLIFRSLMSMKAEDDPISFVQAHWSMATGLMTAGSPILARRHYRMAASVIQERDIRFAKPHPAGRLDPDAGLRFSEPDHERAVLLGKVVHFESFLSLYLTGLPGARPWKGGDGDEEACLSASAESILQEIQASTPDLERQFRQELPVKSPKPPEKHDPLQHDQVLFPALFKMCPLTLRTKTFLLCKDVRRCLGHLQSPNRNNEIVELSQDLVGELQDHLQDLLDLTGKYSKADDHDGSANLRSNAIMTMASLLEIHRTLAGCEVASAAARQHSRSKCGELLSNITLTAQKVVVADGEYLSNFIVYDTPEVANAPDITDVVSPLTVTSLLSIGGFAGTFMPLPSRTTLKDYRNPSKELVDRLINSPSEKPVEINFNLASKTLWSSFVATTLKATNDESRIYVVPDEELQGGSPNTSTGSIPSP